MRHNNGQTFSTVDRDNDVASNLDCSQQSGQGGWWYKDCSRSFLNGRYVNLRNCGNSCRAWPGVVWYDWRGGDYSLKLSGGEKVPTWGNLHANRLSERRYNALEMAERLENSEEVSKNTESGACRASREGRVPCPHNDCQGNAVFFLRGAGLDVHFRAKHGAKPDATTEKAAKQKLRKLCFEEMKQRLQDIEAQEQEGQQYEVTCPALKTTVTATRPEMAAKKVGIILHAGGFLHTYVSGSAPYFLSVEDKELDKTVHIDYHVWYTEDKAKVPCIVCKPVFVKMAQHHNVHPTSNNDCDHEPALIDADISDPLEECLKRVFGLNSFRQGQLEIVTAVHNGGNTFIIMPTGGGKTLCFSLPAVLRKGVTFVIVPLVALGVDLLRRYQNCSIPSVFISHLSSDDSIQKILHDLNSDSPQTKIIITTPESLLGKDRIWRAVLGLKERNLLEMVVIDEAHCMDEMGHEFRPTYLELSKIAELNTQIVAVTATATPTTKDFITKHLDMGNCTVFSSSVDRKNIEYSVRPKGKSKESTEEMVCKVVSDFIGQAGIVYCQTVCEVKDIHYRLQEIGVKVVKYHGAGTGQNEAEGRQALTDWQRGVKDVLVATKAAGAGLDKPDVRFVVHLGCPSSIPDYLQESGRAGRDGRLAKAILFFKPEDKALHIKRIGEVQNEQYRNHALQRLSDMIHFCETEWCRRKLLLEAFAEDTVQFSCNKTCDNCQSPTVAREVLLNREAAAMVRCLSAIRHTVPQPPPSLLARVFLGLGTGKEVKQLKLDELPEFGLGQNSASPVLCNVKLWDHILKK
ncbi:hypothetical protein Bbelb_320190 [Branchiostoma belcheri]|nr:hypothetical protein Bbelb_320190 [Branchiostoma belcheri]